MIIIIASLDPCRHVVIIIINIFCRYKLYLVFLGFTLLSSQGQEWDMSSEHVDPEARPGLRIPEYWW